MKNNHSHYLIDHYLVIPIHINYFLILIDFIKKPISHFIQLFYTDPARLRGVGHFFSRQNIFSGIILLNTYISIIPILINYFLNFDTFPEKYIVHIFCSPARVRRIDHCLVHEKEIFLDIKLLKF